MCEMGGDWGGDGLVKPRGTRTLPAISVGKSEWEQPGVERSGEASFPASSREVAEEWKGLGLLRESRERSWATRHFDLPNLRANYFAFQPRSADCEWRLLAHSLPPHYH